MRELPALQLAMGPVWVEQGGPANEIALLAAVRPKSFLRSPQFRRVGVMSSPGRIADVCAEVDVDPKRPFGTRLQQPVERRRAKRDKLGISISLYSTTQSKVVSLVDVSQSGARIAGHDLPRVGKDVLLKIADVELFGTIVRSNESEAAMKFERPIGPREVESLHAVLEEQTGEATLHPVDELKE